MNKLDELAMAERHVRLGEAHVEGQKARIAQLRCAGLNTALAEQLLATFETTLISHRGHLDLIRSELGLD